MLHSPVRNLARWFNFYVLFCAVLVLLPCCGSVTQSKNQNLTVRLVVPEGENPDLFWYQVTHKTLQVRSGNGDPVTVEWREGQNPAVEIHEGDQIEFLGADDRGRVLVTGTATANGEKTLTIPLRRVL